MRIKIATEDVGSLMAVLRRERKVRELSLRYVAGQMDTHEFSVQRMEEKADLPLGEAADIGVDRLRAYVEALGGTLKIEVELA